MSIEVQRDQRIRDPIHNLISFSSSIEEDNLLWKLLQTKPVQRLRRVKQLGFSDYVYPGATHSRFSHVLGAMHMARRMLGVLERNSVFCNIPDHPAQRRGTLAAALLHDVGHGPYSHVFEDVSSDLGLEKSHEIYTREIIQNSDISTILNEYGIFDETIRFFEKEPGSDPYSTIISSQMDCDRLDFLSRDRYHTGIRSASIDLEWLFDSLRIENVPIDPIAQVSQFSFVVTPKGIGVVEEFIISYMKMYQSIYFHKSTRSVQHMVKDIISYILADGVPPNSALSQNRLVRFFTDSSCRNVDFYLSLDDSSVVSLINEVAYGQYGRATALANRYFARDLYKSMDLPTNSNGQVLTTLVSKFIAALIDGNIEFIRDTIPSKVYKQYAVMEPSFLKNILVARDGEFEAIGEIIPSLKYIPPKKIRLYFRSNSEREKAQTILESCKR